MKLCALCRLGCKGCVESLTPCSVVQQLPLQDSSQNIIATSAPLYLIFFMTFVALPICKLSIVGQLRAWKIMVCSIHVQILKRLRRPISFSLKILGVIFVVIYFHVRFNSFLFLYNAIDEFLLLPSLKGRRPSGRTALDPVLFKSIFE